MSSGSSARTPNTLLLIFGMSPLSEVPRLCRGDTQTSVDWSPELGGEIPGPPTWYMYSCGSMYGCFNGSLACLIDRSPPPPTARKTSDDALVHTDSLTAGPGDHLSTDFGSPSAAEPPRISSSTISPSPSPLATPPTSARTLLSIFSD
eukprot:3992833-Pyramimonas_sp.AAC.2